MTEAGKRGRKGISIRAIHIAMIVCAVIIGALLVGSTYQSSRVFTVLSRETENYIVRQKAAHDLMEASDYLTEMVQHFTLEGDPKYLDNYFEEAFQSKRREAAITTMAENDAEQSLIRNLEEAMEESQNLMYREYYAMKLVIEARGLQDYPETLQAIELKEEDVFLTGEQKMELAQNLVMGKEYYARKEVIREKLKINLETLDDTMTATRQETSAEMMRGLSTGRALVIGLAVMMILLIGLTARLSTLPLINAAERIRHKEPILPEGAREFRQLAESYNEMYGELNREAEKPEGPEPEAPAAETTDV